MSSQQRSCFHSTERWVPTSSAARYLGLSPDSLRRYARQGLLKAGEDYRPGVTRHSPWTWNLLSCTERLNHLGLVRLRGEQTLKDLLGQSRGLSKGQNPPLVHA